jgi:phage I-like protein
MPSIAEHVGTLQSGRELLRFAVDLEQCSREADQTDPERAHWLHIMPLGPDVEARDGRRFDMGNVEAVLASTELPLLVDWEHASEHGDTRAAGWINELKVESLEAGSRAGVWGRVKWTRQGQEHVETQHYRFLSPVVVGKRRDGKFAVERITSVALTNRPALKMHGIETLRSELSARLGPFATDPERPMQDQTRRSLCAALGLADDASDEQLVSAVVPKTGETDALRESCTKLTEQLSQAQTETAELRAELAQHRAHEHKREVEAFITKGVQAGKIPPAARASWLEHCHKSRDNFEAFRSVVYPGLATIVRGGATKMPGQGKRGDKTVSAAFKQKSPHGVDREALRSLGFTEAQILDAEQDAFDPRNKQPEAPEGDDEGDDDELDDEGEPDEEGGGDVAAQPQDPSPQQTGG